MGLYPPAWKKLKGGTNTEDLEIYQSVRRVRSQTKLKKIAVAGPSHSARLGAVWKLTDQSLIADIARNDQSDSVRREAVRKLKNQSVLEHFARNDESSGVRQAAVERLTGQSVLAEIAGSDPSWWVRKAAVERITDQSVLADRITRDENDKVRLCAVGRLTDKAVLKYIAKNDFDWNIRKQALLGLTGTTGLHDAVEVLTDRSLLYDIAMNLKNERFFDSAMKGEYERTWLAAIRKWHKLSAGKSRAAKEKSTTEFGIPPDFNYL